MVVGMDISPMDRSKIEELRLELGDLLLENPEYDTDFDLLRWLQGYDYNLPQIVPKLKSHLKFLKSWNQYQRDQNYKTHPLMLEFYPVGLVGLTGKDNNFLFIECMGLADFDGLMSSVPLAQIIMDRVDRIETLFFKNMRHQEKITGKQSGICLLQDLSGLQIDIHTALNLTTGPYKCLSQFFTAHYVETIHKFIVINPPSFIYYLYKVLRPFIPKKTSEKVIIMGHDWKTEILQYIDKQNLPAHWGGDLVDENGDPMCRSKVVVPIERVPTENYWKTENAVKHLSELVVPAGKRKSITVHVAKEKSIISWNYNADMDYSFAMYRSEVEDSSDFDSMEMVFPLFEHMSKCMKIPESQEFIAHNPGYYHLVFGNNAWWYKLTVAYNVSVR